MDFFRNKSNEDWMKVINNHWIFTKKKEDNEEEDDENSINEIERNYNKQKNRIIQLLKQIQQLNVIYTMKFKQLLEKHSKVNETINGLKYTLKQFFLEIKNKKNT